MHPKLKEQLDQLELRMLLVNSTLEEILKITEEIEQEEIKKDKEEMETFFEDLENIPTLSLLSGTDTILDSPSVTITFIVGDLSEEEKVNVDELREFSLKNQKESSTFGTEAYEKLEKRLAEIEEFEKLHYPEQTIEEKLKISKENLRSTVEEYSKYFKTPEESLRCKLNPNKWFTQEEAAFFRNIANTRKDNYPLTPKECFKSIAEKSSLDDLKSHIKTHFEEGKKKDLENKKVNLVYDLNTGEMYLEEEVEETPKEEEVTKVFKELEGNWNKKYKEFQKWENKFWAGINLPKPELPITGPYISAISNPFNSQSTLQPLDMDTFNLFIKEQSEIINKNDKPNSIIYPPDGLDKPEEEKFFDKKSWKEEWKKKVKKAFKRDKKQNETALKNLNL